MSFDGPTTYVFTPAVDAARACIAAIAKGDARALCEAVASTQMPAKMACALGQQAWRADVANGQIGKYMCDGGLLGGVYTGIIKAQKKADTFAHGDNATTWIANLAITLDDPRVVDVIVDWNPNFRMGPQVGSATVDTTARFFIDAGAPRCAARLMDRKDELVLAPRNRFLREHAEGRALRNAKRLLERGVCDGDEFAVAAIEDAIEDGGRPQVVRFGDMVVTIGLSFVGKSEIVARVGAGQDVARVQARVRNLAEKAGRGDALGCDVCMADAVAENPICGLLKATKHLRPPGVPPFVVVDAVGS